ncbi:MAG: isoprenylcysteine carboxylmethyltransferase family protein [Planctomycetota bacterium]|nr:MAG: isoprenylcysteine carboxylmethyltransferase family protein [Planctomycetota bacterium]
MTLTFFLYPILLAATLGLWWLPFFFWNKNQSLKKIAGILLWWVNIPLYCLMIGPGIEPNQPFLGDYPTFMGYSLLLKGNSDFAAGLAPQIHLFTKWIGLVFMVWGILATVLFIVPRWRAGGPGYDATKLQATGIFAVVRHPQLSSAWFIAAGWSLWTGALHGLITSLMFLVVLRLHAWMEEKHLLIPVFGNDYLEYRKKVKAFIPFIV